MCVLLVVVGLARHLRSRSLKDRSRLGSLSRAWPDLLAAFPSGEKAVFCRAVMVHSSRRKKMTGRRGSLLRFWIAARNLLRHRREFVCAS